jgi:Concanavalin A-like lectin/glucanases superfamily/N-acetylmuramoyl-L-alanine amidase
MHNSLTKARRIGPAGPAIGLLLGATAVWAQPDYPPAIWDPAYTGHWYTSGYSHSFCVIHDMESYFLSVISYFQQSSTQASVHYCVNSEYYDNPAADDGLPGGLIVQMVSEQYWAWHALCWNKYSFGTEHEGFVSNPAWYTEAMYEASAGLQRHLCDVWGIPTDRNHIIGHNEYQNPNWTTWMAANWPQISPNCSGAQTHTDPGPYWNWTHFMELITSNPAPVIVMQPTNLTVAQGACATFSVVASGNEPLSYQWRFNQSPLVGATASSYTTNNVQLANAGGYSVVVSNVGGLSASTTAFLSVLSQLINPAGCILAPSGMVNWWPAEGNAKDIFGSNDGTLQNGCSYVPGKVGMAFHFDGATSHLNLGLASLAPPWTFCAWVNRQDAPGTGAALTGDGTYELKLEQYNRTRQVGITKIGTGDYAFNYIAPVGTWVHLTFVGTGTGTALYVNGVLQDTLANIIPLPIAYLGAGYVRSSSRFVDFMLGSVDEVAVFNRALSDSEIYAIYCADSAGMCRAAEFAGAPQPGQGQLALNLRGQTGKSFTIYASTNLVDWAPLGTVPNPGGAAQFVDYAVTNAVQKFYRASQQ